MRRIILSFSHFKVVNNISNIQELWRTTAAPKDYVEKFLPMGVKVRQIFVLNKFNVIPLTNVI